MVFGPDVTNDATHSMINGLKSCIHAGLVTPLLLRQIYISSVADQHAMPSRHMQHKAVDISRVNEIKIVIQGYRIWGEVNWERRVARH